MLVYKYYLKFIFYFSGNKKCLCENFKIQIYKVLFKIYFYFSDNIKCLCQSFMQGNMKDIVRHPTFKSLPQDMVVELIQMMTQVLDINK